MKYLLDTNIVSALMKGDPVVIQQLSGLARADVAVPQPVFAEIAYGIERLPPSRRRNTLREIFERLRSELTPVAWSSAVTDAFGHIKATLESQGQRIEDFDAAIAAHALASGAVLITANLQHMARVPELRVESWAAG